MAQTFAGTDGLGQDRSAALRTTQERFEAIARTHGEQVAIDSRATTLTYSELNQRANRVAHALIASGVEHGDFVATYVDQGHDLVTAELAALKAGAAFVPIDPTYPADRCRQMLADAGPAMMIAGSSHLDAAGSLARPKSILVLGEDDAEMPEANPEVATDPASPALVLFTSGSTGRAKGVVRSHQSLLHMTRLYTDLFEMTPADRQTQLYPCSVHGGTRDIFNALLNGATLCHYPLRELGYAGLPEWIARKRISIYTSVASVFRHFARQLTGPDHFPDLRLIRVGGEAPFPSDVELYRAHFAEGCVLMCGLGSTECGLVRQYPVDRSAAEAGGPVPLGHAVDEVEVRIVDEKRQPVPAGTVGEIAVRSRYIFDGYLRRDDLNAELIEHDADDPSIRTFYTGDLGVLDEHDCLTHRGRKDAMVKVRGNRVELHEVEAAIHDADGVQDAAVVAKQDSDGTHLIGYVVPSKGRTLTSHHLRQALKDRLPRFAVPGTFVALDRLPTTPNGKVDRQSLPRPAGRELPSGASMVKPATETEYLVAEAYSRVLKRSPLSVTASFFDLGGDSLQAVELILEVGKATGVELPLAALLSHPDARSLSERIDCGMHGSHIEDVVVFRDAGAEGPAMVLLPGRGGTVLSQRGLAQRLPAELTVVGLQFPGVNVSETPLRTMDELANELLRRLRTVRPHGPYMLLGYSFGGKVAYELGHRLRAAGEEVRFLGIIDTTAPGGKKTRPLHQRLIVHLRQMLRASETGRVQRLRDKVRRRRRRDYETVPAYMTTSDCPQHRAIHQLVQACRAVGRSFDPPRYPGEVHLWRCTDQEDWIEFLDIAEDMGWGQFTTVAQIHTLRTSHLDVFKTEAMNDLAEHVNSAIAGELGA